MNSYNLRFNRGLIVDTNLLILLIVGYFDKNYINQYKRTSTYSIKDFEILRDIVDRFELIVTTPHILAEVSNLCIDNKEPDKMSKRFGKFIMTFIDTIFKFKEIYISKNKILILDYFKSLGLTDTALIEIARMNKYNVITDDAGVYARLSYFRIPVANMNHLRSF